MPAIAESERPQTHAVDRAISGIGAEKCTEYKLYDDDDDDDDDDVSMKIRIL